jgi:membrane protease YdiL (CAAX protease family)
MAVEGSSTVSRFEQVAWGGPERYLGLLGVLVIGIFPAIRPLKEWMDAEEGRMLLFFSAATLWLILFPYLAAWKRGARGLLHPPSMIRIIREGVLAIPLTIVAMLIVMIFFIGMSLVSSGEMEPVDSLGISGAQLSLPLMLILTFLVCVAAPLTEEIYFRGFLYPAFKKRFPLWLAAAVQAALWCLLHEYPGPIIFGLFLDGLFLAWIYEQRKTLVTPIAVHMMMNAFALLPALVLIAVNHHTPAADWSEAGREPDWLHSTLVARRIELKETAYQQRCWALEHLGMAGDRDWKAEISALDTIEVRFPKENDEIVKARLGVAEVYLLRLEDARRAVLTARLVSADPGSEPRQRIWALLLESGGLFLIGDEEAASEVLELAATLLKQHGDPLDLRCCRTQLAEVLAHPAGGGSGPGFTEKKALRRILQDYSDFH